MKSKHLIFMEEDICSPLLMLQHSQQRLLAGAAAWGVVGLCQTSFRTVLPLPKPSISTVATWHFPCLYSVMQLQFPLRAEQRKWETAASCRS